MTASAPRAATRWSVWPATLETMPPRRFIAWAVLLALAASLFFFSPKLQLWTFRYEGTFETTRARTFLQQCEAPLRRDIEPAMQWRLLPPLLCHALGLRGRTALVMPWIGVVALLATCAHCLRREGLTATQTLLGTVVVATTSATIVPLGWFGINDAWAWLGLVVVGFGRGHVSLALACLLCPWIDERFIIGLPLACAVRHARSASGERFTVFASWRETLQAGLWLLPYIVTRLTARRFGLHDDSESFIRQHLRSCLVWLPWAPLGWWMACRAGWALVAMAAWHAGRRALMGAIHFGVLIVATSVVMIALAADISRSAALVLPAMLLGVVALVRLQPPTHATRSLAWIAGLNLVIPAAHVVYTKIDLISPLPIELARLLRKIYFPSF
ncbi:MAG TPA: hypothetical protein VM029_00710 [Opitutaceae bacterium]|nr:hypothetical protein [Opitutaceae bacterium]